MLESADWCGLERAFRVDLLGVHGIESQSREELRQLTGGQVPPRSGGNASHAQRSDANAPQLLDRNPDRFHHLADDVIETFMDDDLDDHTLVRLTKDAALVRDYRPSLDVDAIADTLHLRVIRLLQGDDMIFLGETVFWMHHPIGDIAIVRHQEESLRLAIEPSNRVHAFRDLDDIHHGPALFLVADGRDESAWFVQDQESRPWPLCHLAIDADFVLHRVDAGAELGDGPTVDLHAPGSDVRLGCTAGRNPSRGEHALQSLAPVLAGLIGLVSVGSLAHHAANPSIGRNQALSPAWKIGTVPTWSSP